MKPVVARLVVFGAAVGSLALLAGAAMLVLRLAQPTEYPVDRSRDPDGEFVGRVAKVDLYEGKNLARVVEAPAKPAPPVAAAPPAPAPRPKAEPPRVAQPKATPPPPATPAPPPPVVPAPARVAPLPAPPPVVVTPSPPAPAAPTPVAPAAAPPRPAPPAPAQEPDTDGSAAVDWFLKGRR